MKGKLVSVLVLFSFLPICLQANELGFSILNGAKKDVESGATINLIAKISNNFNTSQKVGLILRSKGNVVRFLLNYSNLTVDANKSLNKIVGIQVQNSLESGEYTFEVDAIDLATSQVFGSGKVEFVIKKHYELNLIKLSTPQFKFAGDTVTVSAILQNRSNLTASVVTTISDVGRQTTEKRQIPKDSSCVISYRSTIPKSITAYGKQFINIKAMVEDEPATETYVSFLFDIFPLKSLKFDKYNRFPLSVGTSVVATNRWGSIRNSSLYDIQGNTTFGSKNENRLVFLLRGPDRSGDPLLGLNDSYSVNLLTKHANISFGDDNFSLTTLTESSRSARGAKADLTFGKFNIASFYSVPRYFPQLKHTYSFQGNYTIDDYNNLMLGYLSKVDSSNNNTSLYTVSAYNKFFSWLSTDAEFSIGQKNAQTTKAYSLSYNIHTKGFSHFLSYIYADPLFSGFLSNSTRFVAGLFLSNKNFNINANFNLDHSNMALDTLFANMPYSKNLNIMFGVRLMKNNTLSIGGVALNSQDQSANPLFDYNKYNARLAFQSLQKNFSLNLQAEYGKMYNWLKPLSEQLSDNYSGSIYSSYNFSDVISTNAFVTYQGGQKGVTGFDQFYYGTSLNSKLKDYLSLALQYNSSFEWQYYKSDRNLLSLNLTSNISKFDQLSIGTNYNLKKNSLNRKELNIQLRYSHQFNIPTSIRKDVGSLYGRILNQGVDRVDGIRLRMNGVVIITDKTGFFKFPALPVGTQILEMDASSFGLNAITVKPGPFLLKIEPGRTTNFDFAVTKSARIVGKLTINEDNRVKQKGYVQVKESLKPLIVEAKSGDEVYRVYSTSDGSFRFSDLRPGTWVVKIYTNGLPSGYKIQKNQYNLELLPNEEKQIDVGIDKMARQIIIQKSASK